MVITMAYQISSATEPWNKLKLTISLIYYTLLYMTSLDDKKRFYCQPRAMPLGMTLNIREMEAINILLKKVFGGMDATLKSDSEGCLITYSTFTGYNAGVNYDKKVNDSNVADRLYVEMQQACLAKWGEAQSPAVIIRLNHKDLCIYKRELLFFAGLGEYRIYLSKEKLLDQLNFSHSHQENASSPVNSSSQVKDLMPNCSECHKMCCEKKFRGFSCYLFNYFLCDNCVYKRIIGESRLQAKVFVNFKDVTIKCLYCPDYHKVAYYRA